MTTCHTFKSPFSANTTQHIINSHNGQITLLVRVDRDAMPIEVGDGAVLELLHSENDKTCWIADVKDAEWFNHDRTCTITLDIR